ncbi:hypothetical protein ACEZDB_11945 [Streptacidiphilus sp. N1-3]|uniref:Uncharacterized protein n=1 Tax=Streptacidiphilus alkalitolerans TaxID=3342712 RepID=A0ABV6WZK0_9ACTN
MLKVSLRPTNPYEFTDQELEDLAAQLSEIDEAVAVQINVPPQRGYGVHASEVLHLFLETALTGGFEAVGVKVIESAIGWAQARWKKEQQEQTQLPPRARVVTIYGPRGEVLKDVRIDLPDGQPLEKGLVHQRP